MQPMLPIKSMELMVLKFPIKPIKSIKPKPMEPKFPMGPIKLMEPIKPMESMLPIKAIKLMEPMFPIKPMEFMESIKSMESRHFIIDSTLISAIFALMLNLKYCLIFNFHYYPINLRFSLSLY